MKVTAIIAAGGEGRRMGRPKQFIPLAGKPMLAWSIDAFKSVPAVSEIIVAVHKDNLAKVQALDVKVVEGGKERQDSIANALKLAARDSDIILIHDGARPMVTVEIIRACIKAASQQGAAVVGVPVKDTLKSVGDDSLIINTVERQGLWQVQTPQAFKADIVTRAYKEAKLKATDDSRLIEDLGLKVKMVQGLAENIKVTTEEDLRIAEALLKMRQ